MRRALIADIHSNFVALEAVIADCDAQRVDEIVCLGDMVGYGPQPAECVDLVRRRCKWALMGDQDAARFMVSTSKVNDFARWLDRELKPEWYDLPSKKARWKWMEALPTERKDDDVLYIHGSPRDPWFEYVLPEHFKIPENKNAIEIFSKIARLCFFANTGIPGIVIEHSDWMYPTHDPEHTFELQGVKTLVNVGSVGRPRDKNPKSCYVIYDDQQFTITFRRTAYDLDKFCDSLSRVPGLSERYVERLRRGH